MALLDKHFEIVNQVFAEALSLPGAQRLRFVERASGDSEVKDSVLRLLSRFDRLGDFLETPASTPPGFTTELQPGDVLANRFQIVALLGRGGMGEVYRAQDSDLSESVALKVIRPEWRGNEPMSARFRDEIRLARAINHPNICNIHDLFTADRGGSHLVFFTMELLEGETLAALLKRRGKLDTIEILAIATDIAAGLDAAHRMGIVHRDLKPENIILAGGTRGAVITDFGLAKAVDPTPTPLTQTGAILGTADYMAPEQFLGEAVTAAADIFAFGVVIFEMAAGQKPFPRESIVRAAVRRLTAEPVELRGIASQVPKHWESTLRRALIREPSKRTKTAEVLIKQLRGELRAPLFTNLPSRRAMIGTAVISGAVSLFLGTYRYLSHRRIDRPLLMTTPFTSATAPVDAQALYIHLQKLLQQSEHVRLFNRERIPALWKLLHPGRPAPPVLDPRSAREIALRGAVNFVLTGNLEQSPDEWVLKLNLETIGDSAEHPQDQMAEHFYAKDSDRLLQTGAKAANWVRRTVGESASEVTARNRPPQEVTTVSWEALKEYTAGDRVWRDHSRNPGDAAREPRAAAQVHLRRAIEIDPEFAMAAARLADIEMASDETEKAMAHYRQAVGIISRRNLTDRESMRIAGLFALDMDRFPQAEEIFSRYALEYPLDGLPLFYKAGAVEAQGRGAEALALYDRAIEREPETYSYRINRAVTLLKSRQVDEADRECARASKFDDFDWTDQLRGAVAFARGDLRGITASLHRLRNSGTVTFQSKSFLLSACLFAEQRRWSQAESALQEGLRFDAETGQPPEIHLNKLLASAQLHLLQGRKGDAITVCRSIRMGYGDPRALWDAGALLARAGDIQSARECLPATSPASQKNQWPGHSYRLVRLRAEIVLAAGDARKAFAIMKDTRTPSLSLQWPECQVRTAVKAEEPEFAKAALRRLFANPAAHWLFADISGPGFLGAAIDLAGEAGIASSEWVPQLQFLKNV